MNLSSKLRIPSSGIIIIIVIFPYQWRIQTLSWGGGGGGGGLDFLALLALFLLVISYFFYPKLRAPPLDPPLHMHVEFSLVVRFFNTRYRVVNH